MNGEAEFYQNLSKLTQAAGEPDPIVRTAARAALGNILASAERILHRVTAEALALEGWEQAGKGEQ